MNSIKELINTQESNIKQEFDILNNLDLSNFDINLETGFIPTTPLIRLQNPYYEPWEHLMDQLSDLIEDDQLESRILNLNLLDIHHLIEVEEQKRAFVVLSFLGNSYVWSSRTPKAILPSQIAVPWVQLSSKLGLNAICCNASVCLWNFKSIDPSGDFGLDNLTVVNQFTNLDDENWFYLITISIEALGGPLLKSVFQIINDVENERPEGLKAELVKVSIIVKEMTKNLKRMKERCNPLNFYWKIRTYLAGWKNMEIAGLSTQGLFYEGVNPETMIRDEQGRDIRGCYLKFSGGSAAQSSIIQVLDILLNVFHFPKDVDRSINPAATEKVELGNNKNRFLLEMREYMPQKHRHFLEFLSQKCHVRDYILQQPNNGALVEIYNDCILQLKLFRDYHIQVVTQYIVIPSKKSYSLPSKGSVGSIDSILTKRTLSMPLLPTKDVKIKALKDEEFDLESPLDSDECSSPSDLFSPPSEEAAFVTYGLAKQLGRDDKVLGTGGTLLMPFLKKLRDETLNSSL